MNRQPVESKSNIVPIQTNKKCFNWKTIQ